MATATKRRAKPVLSSLVSAAAVRGAISSGGFATATMSGYAPDGKKHVGIRAATRRTSASIPDLVACASTYFSMLSRRAWLSTWSGSEHQSSKLYVFCQAVEVNCAGGCAQAGTVQSTHKPACAPSTTQTRSAVRSIATSRLRS